MYLYCSSADDFPLLLPAMKGVAEGWLGFCGDEAL